MVKRRDSASVRRRREEPNWVDAAAYQHLIGADKSAFAWEWLRRSKAYREAWSRSGTPLEISPRLFGLERFEDPSIPTPDARPVWSAEVFRDVILANVVDPFAKQDDRIDLRLLSPFVTLSIDEAGTEHLLLSDGPHAIRIDIVDGTLIGCPAALSFVLNGFAGLRGPMAALERLAKLVQSSKFIPQPEINTARHHRWTTELRVADAVRSGARQQEIARVLFGNSISDQRWRTESAPYRRRVQRLVAEANRSLRSPLHKWFGTR